MITGSIWFTSGDTRIGIVQVIQDHQKEQYRQTGEADFVYYIGTGQGFNEKDDAVYIADWGSPFPAASGAALFGEE